MRTIKYTVSYEKLISRIPAMFAFVRINEQGTPSIVKATDGEQGNYGQIVADLNCPKFPSDKAYYECKDGTLLSLSKGRHSYRTVIDVYYRFVDDIKERLSDEWDERIKTAVKEWEKKKKDNTSADIDSPYRKFEDVLNEEKGITKENGYTEFVKFVEKGVGLVYVGLSEEEGVLDECGTTIKKKYPLAPDYIYLGEVRTFYEKVAKIKKQLDFWKSHTQLCKEDIKHYKMLLREFEMMNGDKLLIALADLITKAETVASYYYDNALSIFIDDKNKDRFYPQLNFKVNLTNTIKDLGMVTPHIQEWVAGKRYYDGDIVYHVDQYGYGITWKCSLQDAVDKSGIQTDEFGREYITGQYDEETELIYFEDGSQTPIDGKTAMSYWIPQSLNLVNRNHRFICSECGRVYEKESPEVCQCGNREFIESKYVNDNSLDGNTVTIKGTCNSHLTSLRKYGEYMNYEDQIEFPSKYKDWLWYYRIGTITNREASYDENGNVAVMYPNSEEDIKREDFYAQGVQAIVNEVNNNGDILVGANIVFQNDDGDILVGEKIVPQDYYAINLAIWGDILTKIEAKNYANGTGEISFEYWIGAHLKAKKGVIITVKNDFTVGGKLYKKGDIIGHTEYEKLTNEGKGKLKFVTAEDFIEGGRFFRRGDTIEQGIYNALNEINKNKVSYDVRISFRNDGKYYTIGQEINREEYETLGARKDNILITVKQDFSDGGTEYKKGSVFTMEEYNKLTENNKYCIEITAREKFVEPQVYRSGLEISPSAYFGLSDKNRSKVIIQVTQDFTVNGFRYNKNDFIQKENYDALTSDEKNNVVFIVMKTFSYTDNNKITEMFASGKQIAKSKYDNLPDALKENVGFKVIENFVHGGKTYNSGDSIEIVDYEMFNGSERLNVKFIPKENITLENTSFNSGDVITTAVYESLSDSDQVNCEVGTEWYSIDDDGNYKYFFKEFEIDTDSVYGKNQGVKYTETYIYNKSEEFDSIWQLVESGRFTSYVEGKYDKGSKYVADENEFRINDKYEFNTDSNVYMYDIKIGDRFKNIPYLRTNFETVVDIKHVDVEETPLIRYDYYSGVNYQPNINTDVYVERGVTQAFEKHIKFSEIKTFADMENYANGGFFVISKENIDLG